MGAVRRAVRMCRFQPIEHVRLLEHPGVPRVRQRRAHVLRAVKAARAVGRLGSHGALALVLEPHLDLPRRDAEAGGKLGPDGAADTAGQFDSTVTSLPIVSAWVSEIVRFS